MEDVESEESGAGVEVWGAGEVVDPVILVRLESKWLLLAAVGRSA